MRAGRRGPAVSTAAAAAWLAAGGGSGVRGAGVQRLSCPLLLGTATLPPPGTHLAVDAVGGDSGDRADHVRGVCGVWWVRGGLDVGAGWRALQACVGPGGTAHLPSLPRTPSLPPSHYHPPPPPPPTNVLDIHALEPLAQHVTKEHAHILRGACGGGWRAVAGARGAQAQRWRRPQGGRPRQARAARSAAAAHGAARRTCRIGFPDASVPLGPDSSMTSCPAPSATQMTQ